ncbi:MAG: VC_2705 family sodium/solute symporter, partial [Erythrobacter sp.]|nr:VC_2705 family sodium/solute symporter [Erythrobacter sp.]
GSTVNDGSGLYVLEKLNLVLGDLGFGAYTDGQKSMIDVFCITLALMVGTAGLPHVIVRFFTVPKASDARKSAGWALVFIALLYTTAPAVGAFARLNFIDNVNEQSYSQAPGWFTNWETNDLIAFKDKNGDGVMQYRKGDAFAGKPEFTGETGASGERAVSNAPVEGNANELYVDQDIMVLANPEIGNLPGWVVALVAAGGLAAALSTAAGLLLVISASVSHDLLKQTFRPDISEKGELRAARIAATVAIVIAGYLGVYPPGWVAQVVAFAFGLAAATLFPAIFMGIFSKRMNKEGAIAGMVSGLVFTFGYIVYFKLVNPQASNAANWLLGISPEGIGVIGMLINFGIALAVSSVTSSPPLEVRKLVDSIRVPRGAGEAQAH